MSASKGFRTPDASDKPERGDANLNLKTVHRMLPLVQRIVDEILTTQKALARLHPEEEVLDHQKRVLSWPQRQRRYQLKDEVARADTSLHGALAELQELGVVLLDEELGRVGFPTVVNNRRAFFSWQPGEEGLHSWQFADEDTTRPIPPSWLAEISLTGTK